MKKASLIVLATLAMSFLPLSANAGHFVYKCYKPCGHCTKACKRFWVEHHHDGYRYHRHHHGHHNGYHHGHHNGYHNGYHHHH